ncbi:MAG TPA: TolC family protein [Gemmatimonadaceae bacterium]|nr:TolC family protein [Gemmatimonadaceae bacterium]
MRLALPLAAFALAAQTVQAQTPQVPQASQTPATVSLDEAIALARRNNPLFNVTVNARKSADLQLRSAYASLLPSVSGSASGRFQKTGQQFFNGIALANQSDVVQSSYGIGVNYNVNSAVLFAPKLYTAQRNAAEADVTGALELLRATVTQQYITVLQAQARAALQDTLKQTTDGQLELAKARQAVGAGTILDVRRAEVASGQSEVAALQAHNTARVEVLRLFQQLGVPKPDSVELTTRFQITPIAFNLDSLQDLARTRNPGMNALRSRETAATAGVRARQGQYLPSLQLSTGWGWNAYEYTNSQYLVNRAQSNYSQSLEGCFSQDSIRTAVGMPGIPCSSLISPVDENAIRAQNSQFPFNGQRAPFSFSAFVSLPIFDNFAREQNLQEAQIQRDNAKFNVRAGELKLTADVAQAYLNLQTAAKTVEMQDVNAARAREELSFAEERYKVGAATFLDVTTSRGTFEQAQIDRLNAIYDYHKAFAALENAVGRPLR